MKVAVVGATGMTGRRVVGALVARGHAVVATGRDPAKLAALGDGIEWRIGDFDRPETLPKALAGADAVAYVAHAKHTKLVLDAMEPGARLVVTGSTRVFSKLEDPAAQAVREGLAAFAATGRKGQVLLPAMIYGAKEDRNVGRVLRFLARFPRWCPIPAPLPDGGRHTVQPIHVEDVAACVAAALERPENDGPPIVLAGPEPIAYARMVRECAAALRRRVLVIPVPVRALALLARAMARLGLKPPFDAKELTRAAEDKAFDIAPMRERLGVIPRPFADGVAAKVIRGDF
ncbi:MAG: SDR family oxidoreductase [Tagaea sp.]|nr:NAD(P)H-binding protein [Azospirillum sp.]MCZ8123673.1 NAD(P)H-binding protein [Magnetospirillum sp.]